MLKSILIRSPNNSLNLFNKNLFHQKPNKQPSINPFKRKINENDVNIIRPSGNSQSSPLGYFTKTALATLTFTGICFSGCAIYLYENKRNQLTNKLPFSNKRYEPRNQLNKFWSNLPLTAKITSCIIFANCVVFACWRIRAINALMNKYFLANPLSQSKYLSMLLSTFSHHDPLHFFFNMACLWSFVMPLHSIFGGEQFLAYYLSSGLFASFLSNNYKIFTNRIGPSLGASGSIMACVIMSCLSFPENKIGIMFIPYGFEANDVMKFLIGFDLAGLLLGWRVFDHAAHLGGSLFALWYYYYGHQILWKNQKKLIDKWHKFRTSK